MTDILLGKKLFIERRLNFPFRLSWILSNADKIPVFFAFRAMSEINIFADKIRKQAILKVKSKRVGLLRWNKLVIDADGSALAEIAGSLFPPEFGWNILDEGKSIGTAKGIGKINIQLHDRKIALFSYSKSSPNDYIISFSNESKDEADRKIALAIAVLLSHSPFSGGA